MCGHRRLPQGSAASGPQPAATIAEARICIPDHQVHLHPKPWLLAVVQLAISTAASACWGIQAIHFMISEPAQFLDTQQRVYKYSDVYPPQAVSITHWLTFAGGRPKSRRNSMEDPYASRDWMARHPLQLQSACQDILGCELPYTSCHGKFIGTVDFVWFGSQVRCFEKRTLSAQVRPCL